MTTAWYSIDEMALTGDNVTFSSVQTTADGVARSQDASAWITEVWNLSATNSSYGNATDMHHCDTDKPTLIIITQVLHGP
jgi:hypothetical protein